MWLWWVRIPSRDLTNMTLMSKDTFWRLDWCGLETFQATWKLSRPPGNFSDHSGNFLLGKLLAQACAPWNDHFNANIFVYCVQKVFYDGGSPYGGSTAPKASGSPGPIGDLFRIWVFKRSPFFSRSPFRLKKSQSSHYLLMLTIWLLVMTKQWKWHKTVHQMKPICAGEGPH